MALSCFSLQQPFCTEADLKMGTEFVCLCSPGWAPVQLAVCWVQQDPACVFPVGAEECRCSSPGALGVWFVCAANQPSAGFAASLCLLLWIQGTITRHCHYYYSLLTLKDLKWANFILHMLNIDMPEQQYVIIVLSCCHSCWQDCSNPVLLLFYCLLFYCIDFVSCLMVVAGEESPAED